MNGITAAFPSCRCFFHPCGHTCTQKHENTLSSLLNYILMSFIKEWDEKFCIGPLCDWWRVMIPLWCWVDSVCLVVLCFNSLISRAIHMWISYCMILDHQTRSDPQVIHKLAVWTPQYKWSYYCIPCPKHTSCRKRVWRNAGEGIKARNHACAEITHFPTRCIIRAWEAQGCRPNAFQVLIMHWDGKCAISAVVWVLASIPWPVRNIKAAMWKLCISTHPFSAWIVSWSWDKGQRQTTTLWWH